MNGITKKCDGYEFYEDLLRRSDIDAVEVVTPDHWHALATINACKSGKDVYCQKPLAFTIVEALTMVRAVRDNSRILQVGSQQRSGKEFQKAIELVQNGSIGYINKVYARVGDPPGPFDLPKQKVPINLNWDKWVGPLNNPKVHYNEELCPQISLDPVVNEKIWGAWRWYRATGNGYTSDWGAHMFDIAQAALGMDGIGPVEFVPPGYNGTKYSTMKYANGVVMTQQPYLDDNENAKGIKFWGTDGWIEVARGYLACSDMSKIPEELRGNRPLSTAELERRRNANNNSGRRQYNRTNNTFTTVDAPHKLNFIQSIKSRIDPVAPVEPGCSTSILCDLVNMAIELGRPIKWNPATHKFIDNKKLEQHRLFSYEYRNPYKL